MLSGNTAARFVTEEARLLEKNKTHDHQRDEKRGRPKGTTGRACLKNIVGGGRAYTPHHPPKKAQNRRAIIIEKPKTKQSKTWGVKKCLGQRGGGVGQGVGDAAAEKHADRDEGKDPEQLAILE